MSNSIICSSHDQYFWLQLTDLTQ